MVVQWTGDHCCASHAGVVVQWTGDHCCLCMTFGALDWHGACIVPLLNGNGDKCECINSRCVSLLSAVGKLYAWQSAD